MTIKNRIAFLAYALASSAFTLSVREEAVAKTEEQINAEKAEAAAAKKAAADQAKAEKAEAAAKAKAEKAEAARLAKEAREAAKAAEAEQKAAAKAAKEEEKRLAAEKKAAEREAAATTKVKIVMPSQRGVTRPKDGTKTGKVWELADALSAAKGSPVAIGELQPKCLEAGLNDATTRTQYARWKQFHGIYGTVAKTPVAGEQATNDGTAQATA